MVLIEEETTFPAWLRGNGESQNDGDYMCFTTTYVYFLPSAERGRVHQWACWEVGVSESDGKTSLKGIGTRRCRKTVQLHNRQCFRPCIISLKINIPHSGHVFNYYVSVQHDVYMFVKIQLKDFYVCLFFCSCRFSLAWFSASSL